MRTRAKKLLSLILTLAVMVGTIAALGIGASAKSVFSGAVKMDQLEFYSRKFKKAGDEFYYKIVLPSSGKIMFRCSNNSGFIRPGGYFYNKNAEELATSSFGGGMNWEIKNLEKGTYYLKLRGDSDNSSVTDFYYTFTPDETPSIKLAITMKKGDELQLGSLTENYDGKVTWVSTKKEVAALTGGKVKAVGKGQTTVRAAIDNGTYAEIKIVVK